MTLILTSSFSNGNKKEVYKDASAPVKDRVEDLLKRMTLEEKVGQMNQFVGIEHFKSAQASLTAEELRTNTANAFYPNTTVEDMARTYWQLVLVGKKPLYTGTV